MGVRPNCVYHEKHTNHPHFFDVVAILVYIVRAKGCKARPRTLDATPPSAICSHLMAFSDGATFGNGEWRGKADPGE